MGCSSSQELRGRHRGESLRSGREFYKAGRGVHEPSLFASNSRSTEGHRMPLRSTRALRSGAFGRSLGGIHVMEPPMPPASDGASVQPAMRALVQAASAGWVRRPDGARQPLPSRRDMRGWPLQHHGSSFDGYFSALRQEITLRLGCITHLPALQFRRHSRAAAGHPGPLRWTEKTKFPVVGRGSGQANRLNGAFLRARSHAEPTPRFPNFRCALDLLQAVSQMYHLVSCVGRTSLVAARSKFASIKICEKHVSHVLVMVRVVSFRSLPFNEVWYVY